jgi:hypothetical protein
VSGESKANLFWLAVLVLIMGVFFGLGCSATCKQADKSQLIHQGTVLECAHGRDSYGRPRRTCLGWKPEAGVALVQVKTCQ